MDGVRLEWNVWSGAAAALVAAALVALVAVLSGPYSVTDSRILYSLAAALLGASTLLAGRALVTGGSGSFLGWAAVVLAPAASTVLLYAIWNGAVDRNEAETPFWLGLMTLVAALLATTARLLARASLTVWMARAAGIFGALAATLSFDAATTNKQFWKVGTVITILWGVAALLYFLVPVLERAFKHPGRWLIVAGVLVGGTVTGLVALLEGEFAPQGYSLFFTLLAAIVALAAMLGGVVLLERRAWLVGGAALVLSPLAFALLANAFWDEPDDWARLISTGVVVLAGLLVAVAARLFAGTRASVVLASAAAAAAGAAVVIAVNDVWGDHRTLDATRTTNALWIVATACCLLVPVLDRYLATTSRSARA